MTDVALPHARKQDREDLEGMLDKICGLVDCGLNPTATDKVSFREVMAAIGRRAYGPLLLLVGLFSISPATIVPGMTWFAAALTLLISGQMALGFRRPWLPKSALDMTIQKDLLVKGVAGFRPWARRIDALLRPRFEFFTAPPLVNVIALMCVGAALLTFPLGFIPFAPLAPGAAIVLFGLGMTARDGLLLMFGVAIFAVAVAVALNLIV